MIIIIIIIRARTLPKELKRMVKLLQGIMYESTSHIIYMADAGIEICYRFFSFS
jgi:hypothetical protein